MAQAQLGEGDGAHLLLGDQLLDRGELLVGESPALGMYSPPASYSLIRIRTFRGAAGISSRPRTSVRSDPLLVAAEVFAEPGGVAVATARDQFAGDGRRVVLFVGEDGRLVVGDDAVDRPFEAAPVGGDENRIVPRLLDLGKGVLHRADVGEEFELVLRQVAQQIAADAEEERDRRRRAPPARRRGSAGAFDDRAEIAADRQLFAR